MAIDLQKFAAVCGIDIIQGLKWDNPEVQNSMTHPIEKAQNMVPPLCTKDR